MDPSNFCLLGVRGKPVPYFEFGILNYNAVPVAARSKAWFCGRSFAGFAASNHSLIA